MSISSMMQNLSNEQQIALVSGLKCLTMHDTIANIKIQIIEGLVRLDTTDDDFIDRFLQLKTDYAIFSELETLASIDVSTLINQEQS
jgi:hypothetical protein